MKTYKSYRQLLNILRSRGMCIKKGGQGSRVMRILEKENYYNIINGYKDLFLCPPVPGVTTEVYLPGTTFDEVYALYCFDRDLRGIYLRYLLKAESSLKAVIAHEFSEKYGHDNYLKVDNFQATNEKQIANVVKLIGDIQQELARQMSKHHQAVTHYMTQHGYIPLWVLVNVLTFGKITNFYSNMKPLDKISVAKCFGVPDDELHKYMMILSLARNKCAHDERFFDFRSRNTLHTKSIRNFAILGVPRKPDGSYVSGIGDAFAVAIILALLLEKSDTKEFISSMKKLFDKLSRQQHTIPITRIKEVMGFPGNWANLRYLK